MDAEQVEAFVVADAVAVIAVHAKAIVAGAFALAIHLDPGLNFGQDRAAWAAEEGALHCQGHASDYWKREM